MSLYVKRNTFPELEYPVDGIMRKVPHAEPGDKVEWKILKKYYKETINIAGRPVIIKKHKDYWSLARESDGKVVFDIEMMFPDQVFPEFGIITEDNIHGYVLELEEK